jgi:hypothetical protein
MMRQSQPRRNPTMTEPQSPSRKPKRSIRLVRRPDPDGVAVFSCSCECMGFLAHGHCKHVEGLLALMREGQL